ncbi:UDP-glucuronosyltransferase 1-8-like [Pomacea canaliculata]|uniref:UDP-glucuronosyltransferase 1-8-like n=1 Tax=Pomacea canaliculata TaxID=400727 RepID=UPI000D7301D3|nr:UDP-glucuronosyltransferase 1-8-like [Pomacea canaliculata]
MAGRWWWWRWLLVLCLLPLLVTRRSGVSAYRVTLIPLPETGHCRQMVGVGRQLLSQGHQVLLYVPSYFKIRRCTEPAPTDDIQVQVFRVDPTVAAVLDSLDSIMEAVRGGNVAARPSARPVRDVLGHVCQSYLEARDDLEGLKKFKPDLFLSYFSKAWADASLAATFRQGNTLGAKLSKVDYGVLFRRAVLFLENSDYILDYPKANFPNFVQVGGLTAAPGKPLPGPLQRFFDGADDRGVVVVSFGSQLLNPTSQVEEKLLLAFRHVDARVLLRLNASTSVTRLGHVQIASWFPQNDALGHPKVRLFVSHCGKNGFFEALYHGVPILCTPFHSHTVGTGTRVNEFGVGHMLDFLAVSADKISSTINSMLADKGLSKRMKMASYLFKNRPETPCERAAMAIERVIKYGGVHLRPRSIDLNFFQHAGLDVAFAVFALCIGIVVTVVFAVLHGVRYVRGASSSADSHTKLAANTLHQPENQVHETEVSVHQITDDHEGAAKLHLKARNRQSHDTKLKVSDEVRHKVICVVLLVAVALFYYLA